MLNDLTGRLEESENYALKIKTKGYANCIFPKLIDNVTNIRAIMFTRAKILFI